MTARILYSEIKDYCIRNADEALAQKYSRYFKEGYDAYGLAQPLLHDKVKSLLAQRWINLKLVLETSKMLVQSGKYEETFFAILLLKAYNKQFTAGTLRDVASWFSLGINNWAHCDVLCGEILSPLLNGDVVDLSSFTDWKNAKNKFQRRAVPVTLIKHLRFTSDFQILFNFIESLMMDPDREVHQGLGWFLREAWKLKKIETERFLMKWKNKSPRLIYQYACEKMTALDKQRFKKSK